MLDIKMDLTPEQGSQATGITLPFTGEYATGDTSEDDDLLMNYNMNIGNRSGEADFQQGVVGNILGSLRDVVVRRPAKIRRKGLKGSYGDY